MAKDARGVELAVGDLVAAPYSNSMLRLATVTKLCPKTVQVKGTAGQEYWKGGSGQYYSKDLVKLDATPVRTEP